MLDSYEESGSSPSGTGVRCNFDFQNLRSDEMGLGPFSGSYFDFGVLEGKIVFLFENLDVDEFSPQMWDPFATGWLRPTQRTPPSCTRTGLSKTGRGTPRSRTSSESSAAVSM